MAGFIQIDPSEVQALASKLTGRAEQLLSELASLANEADPGGIWTGEAASSYKAAFDTWHSAEVQAKQALEQLARAVSTISNNFDEINQQGATAFGSFFGS